MNRILILICFMTTYSCANKENHKCENNLDYKQTKTIDMEFRASFCNPFKKDIIELGSIEKEKVIEKFNSVDWTGYKKRMESAKEGEIYYSPSLEIENKTNKNGLAISAIDGKEWYIFYKRPKVVKRFFGLSEKLNENYLTDITGQTKQDVINCLNALLKNDLKYLEEKIK